MYQIEHQQEYSISMPIQLLIRTKSHHNYGYIQGKRNRQSMFSLDIKYTRDNLNAEAEHRDRGQLLL